MADRVPVYLINYIQEIQQKMNLKDWEIIVRQEKGGSPGALAEVEVVDGKKCAHIWLNDEFLESDPHTQRYAVVHELVHCHFNHILKVFNKTLNTKIHPDLFDSVYAMILWQLEIGVDAMANLLAHDKPFPQDSLEHYSDPNEVPF